MRRPPRTPPWVRSSPSWAVYSACTLRTQPPSKIPGYVASTVPDLIGCAQTSRLNVYILSAHVSHTCRRWLPESLQDIRELLLHAFELQIQPSDTAG
eukprot:5694784-Prymnesium_polylepis.1